MNNSNRSGYSPSLSALLLIILINYPFFIFAQTKAVVNPPPDDSLRNPQIPQSIVDTHQDVFHSFEFILFISILLFGLIILLMIGFLAYKKVIEAHQVMKSIVLTLVIICSLLLITAGYSNSQIAGVTGLLGSIAGYLLAKPSRADKEN